MNWDDKIAPNVRRDGRVCCVKREATKYSNVEVKTENSNSAKSAKRTQEIHRAEGGEAGIKTYTRPQSNIRLASSDEIFNAGIEQDKSIIKPGISTLKQRGEQDGSRERTPTQ